MGPAYVYAATINRIVDGDTYEVTVDLGFRMSTTLPLRLAHFDTPERFTPEGKVANAFVAEFFGPLPAAVTVETYKPVDKYGRYLANVARDGRDLGQALFEAKIAKPYEGGAKL